MRHVMVDLETLGSTPGCVILSIGAVAFSAEPPYLDEGFYIVVNTEDCMAHYLSQEPDTVAWWDRQSEEARQVVGQARDTKTSVPLRLALEKFNEYLGNNPRQTALWGNGSDFDNAILAVAYRMVAVESGDPTFKPAWDHWNNRCYRTLKNLVRGPKLERVGTYHNALDDARSQALHAVELLRSRPELTW